METSIKNIFEDGILLASNERYNHIMTCVNSHYDLLAALEGLRAELRQHIKMDVKKHYSLMVADVAADKAIARARGE